MKKAPVVALYGIGGTYNFGCEAIVRGTAIILRDLWPDLVIRYVSSMPEYDRERLSDTGVQILHRKEHGRFSLPRLAAALLRRCGVPRRFLPFYEDVSWLEDCDMVFSIGGDMYTLSAAYRLAHLAEIAQRQKKKFIIWGASIGPLPPGNSQILWQHFRTADLITSREPTTTRFLADHRVTDNVVEVADPAFAVSSEVAESAVRGKRPLIGVNLSPLTAISAVGEPADEILDAQTLFIGELIERLNVDVVLIPHVVTDSCSEDDDLRYLCSLRERTPEQISSAVAIADFSGGYRGVKKVLQRCDLVIASRMHCAINALSEGVPVLFVAYSQKAHGMCEYAYGSKEWVVDSGELLGGKGIELVAKMLDNRQALRDFLLQRMARIVPDTYRAQARLDQLRQPS